MSPKLSVVAVLTLVALAGMASVGHADLEPAMGFTGGLTGDDELTAVAVDAAGNYYVAGVRNTRIDLSGTVSLAGLGSFLAKFSLPGPFYGMSTFGAGVRSTTSMYETAGLSRWVG